MSLLDPLNIQPAEWRLKRCRLFIQSENNRSELSADEVKMKLAPEEKDKSFAST